MDEEIRERLDALERAVTAVNGDERNGDVAAAFRDSGFGDIRDRIEELEDSVAELEASNQALRGYVGNIRSVNRDVEQRAEAALAKVESLEADLGVTGHESAVPGTDHSRFESTPLRSTPGGGGGVHWIEPDSVQDDSGKSNSELPHCRTCGTPTIETDDDGEPWRAPSTENGSDGRSTGPVVETDGPLQRLRDLL